MTLCLGSQGPRGLTFATRRTQARNDYFHKANLFAHDVEEDSLMKDRDHFLNDELPEMDL